MEGLRWWLLLLTAVMFSMAGCATRGQEWSTRTAHPAPFASTQHLAAPTILVLERLSQ